MAQFDGIGRIYQAELAPNVDRSPQTDRTERDRKRRDKEEKQEEEPKDSVELHEEEGPKDSVELSKAEDVEDSPKSGLKPKLPPQDEERLDISA